jgi:hypothetical protein
MPALLPVLLPLGLFLPGLFFGKALGRGLWWAAAFLISLLVLFHSAFWLDVLHMPVTLWTVLPILAAASAAGWWFYRKYGAAAEAKPAPGFTWPEKLLLGLSGLVGAILLVHVAITPLIGGDAPFRWDFLAQRILALHHFNFYPPLTPADFRSYFYPDGIPPLVQFSNWWMYASAGQHLPWLICLFVAAQYACTLAFTYGAASTLFSRRAGVFAAAVLASSPLYFRSLVIAQETGLTALAIAAMLYFIVSARVANDTAAAVAAGLAAAACALSREYGWIAVIAGAIALIWRRVPAKQIAVFGAAAFAVAFPWYARTWMLTGNPFYSLRFLGFPVNPVHDRIMHYYSGFLGVEHWWLGDWFLLLVPVALFPMLAGITGGLMQFRRNGYLLVSAVLLIAVWIASIALTSGGVQASTRVLSPALVVLSITAAGLLERAAQRKALYAVAVLAIAACQLWTAADGAVHPNYLSTINGDWFDNAFPRIPLPSEFQIRDQLVKFLPPGRVLSDSAYLHAALVDRGVEVVPVWSPEVRFLFSASPEEAERQLKALNITSIVCYPKTTNMAFLVSASRLYASLPERWKPHAQVGDFLFVFTPKNP